MYKRRVIIFLVLMALGLTVEIVRLWQLQVVEADEYRLNSPTATRRIELLPAPRGSILDRTGRVLARDKDCRDLCMDYRLMVQDDDWVKSQVRQIARRRGIAKAQAAAEFAELSRHTWNLVYAAAREQLVLQNASATQPAATASLDQAAHEMVDSAVEHVKARVAHLREMVGTDVQEERHAHPLVPGLDEGLAVRVREAIERHEVVGLAVSEGTQRVYDPQASQVCHLLGYIGPVDAEEQRALNIPSGEADSLTRMLSNYLDTDTIGKAGVERFCEYLLRGHRGYKEYNDRDAEPSVVPPEPGRDVRLSVDLELQARVAAAFKQYKPAYNGAAVAIDVRTGQVLAMVSIPMYDPSTFRRDLPELMNDGVNYPLLNRAVGRAYPPGSTAKPMSALAALTEGAITEATTFTCNGLFDGHRCMGVHGTLAVQRAIRKSCNVFFYHVGLEMERHYPGELCEWFKKFGLADPAGTGLREEHPGNVPARTTPGEAEQLAIGQGRLLATPIHVANEMATIARSGIWMAPTVLADDPDPRPTRDLKLSAANLRVVRAGMHDVVNGTVYIGSAYKTFHDPTAPPLPAPLSRMAGGRVLSVNVAGKTGTAQTAVHWKDLNGNHRLDEDEIIHKGDMAWFAGFAPYDNPQVAFAVVVEYVGSGTGATNAGPIAREMLRALAELGYVK